MSWRNWFEGAPFSGLRKEQFLGECTGCGECCRLLTLVDRGRPVKSLRHFERMVRRDPTYRFFRPLEDRDPDGYLYFSCLLLDSNGRCQEYAERPLICREFPNSAIIDQGATLPAACGYFRASESLFRLELERATRRHQPDRMPPWRSWWRLLTPRRIDRQVAR